MDEQASTYFVYNRQHDKEELRRLIIQDWMVTAAMGGVLAEQPDPTVFRRVLDVACGTGGWVIEAARRYPEMHLWGVDISHRMIEYACAQARGNDRVEFRVMDALRQFAFPDDAFDLVNLRFGVSFIRMWEWPGVVSEMLRVTRPGGVVRITDAGIVQESTSPALRAFQLQVVYALERAGHVMGGDEGGVTGYLVPLLERCGVRRVERRVCSTRYEAGMGEGDAYVEDVCCAMRTLKPFVQRWVGVRDYERVCQVAREQMGWADFCAAGELVTVWGGK